MTREDGQTVERVIIQYWFQPHWMEKVDFNFLKCGVAGGLAGLCVDIIEFPIETIKTRIMGSSPKENIVKNTAGRSKFRGISAQIIIAFPYSFTFFLIYEGLRDRMPDSHMTNFIAAVCAETVSNIIKNPLELVKQQMMVGRSDRITTSLREVTSTLGLRGFYIGYTPALVRDIVFSALEMPMFEHFKPMIGKMISQEENSPMSSAIAGGLGATISSILTCPLDVIKTRHMTMRLNEVRDRSLSSSSVAKIIFEQEGLKGFFRGVWYRAGLLTTGGIIYFYCIAHWRKVIGARR